MGLSRLEFYSRIGLLRQVDPITNAAYKFVAGLQAQASDRGHGADADWHVSFHGSEFPGYDEKACGRRAMYRMMDIPRNNSWKAAPGTFDRQMEQIMDAGKDVELQLVRRWDRAGYLLSAAAGNVQTYYEDPEHWLTCTTDAMLLWPRAIRPFVVEVKSKYARVIEDMRNLIRGPDDKHVNQIKTEIAMAHEAGSITVLRCFNTDLVARNFSTSGRDNVEPLCPLHMDSKCLYEVELEPVEHGTIYYVSRDNPFDTFEFLVTYDADFMAAGRRRLKQFQKAFLEGKLPQSNFENKRFAHPFKWKWTEQPCKWCEYGDVCREDMKTAKEKVRMVPLAESAAIEAAQQIRPDYDFAATRAAVLARWGITEPEKV